MGEFIRRALNLEIKWGNRIYSKGFKAGFSKAKEKYIVRVWCAECCEPITVLDGESEMEVGNAVAREYHWYHKGCKPPNMSDNECRLFDRE